MATFSNVATLRYNNTTAVSNVVVGELEENLTMSKTAARNVYSGNNYVTYAISLVNNGANPNRGITLVDNLGGYSFTPPGGTVQTLYPLDYVDGSLKVFEDGIQTNTATVTGTQPLTITGINVPANGNTMVIYEARPNEFAPRNTGNTIINQVTASGAGVDPVLTALDTITVLDEPILTIQKALNPSIVSENDTVTYTFTIENTGDIPAQPQDNLSLSDTFNPRLQNITVEVDGTALPATSYNYNPATGVFTTVPGILTVPAAVSAQDVTTGEVTTTPGMTTVTVSGTIG